MKVVILCGGKGTRLREETEYKPKPLVEIGGKPILWHIMKIYSQYGFNDFILCLGYKGKMIKEFFMEYDWNAYDFSLDLQTSKITKHTGHHKENWNITFAETGLETLTGGRVKKIQKYIDDDEFMLTYGDGVADIDINKLVDFHRKMNKVVTISGVHPFSKYGLIKMEKGEILDFDEKPRMKDLVNAGFMVCKKEFFDCIETDCMFESDVLPALSKRRQAALYEHRGFWHPMDTYKDYSDLSKMWENNPPWKIW